MSRQCKWNDLKIYDARGYVLARVPIKVLKGQKASYLRKKFKKLLDIDKDIVIETNEDYKEVKTTCDNLGI